MIEGFPFQSSNAGVGYDGSGYTVQMNRTTQSSCYDSLWKMVTVHDGDAHLGLPPDTTLAQYQPYTNSMCNVSGLSGFQARRRIAGTPPLMAVLIGVTSHISYLAHSRPP